MVKANRCWCRWLDVAAAVYLQQPCVRRRPRATAWLLLALLLAATAGCTRTDYRLRADADAYARIAEKSNDPRWDLPGFTLDMDPRSRYYDPTNPDRPPMPQDDPASHVYMHMVDGKRGWKHWHRDGDRYELENPAWRERLGEYVDLTDEGAVKLQLESAVRLAMIHSPNYREQLETIYLSALDVTAERFRFDTQFFGGNTTFFTANGRDRGFGESQSILETATDGQIRRRLATGGEVLVGFANSFVWQFAGPNTNDTNSILNFNIVQPLLRAGGRAVALEQLTIVERGLLANLRAFERYRQGFYTSIAVGDLGVTGPQRQGGFFGGTGLTGFTGQGAGGFGAIGEVTGFARGGFGGARGTGGGGGTTGFAGGGAGTIGGFVGMLQQLQQIRNTQDSLNAQLRALALLEANLEAGLIDIAQVDQFRQNIETERANLLQARNTLENTLDTFKTQTLGLPPDLPTELDDTLIRQFQFIDPRSTALQTDIADFTTALGDLPTSPTLDALAPRVAIYRELRERAARQLQFAEEDLRRMDSTAQQRLESMTPEERSLFATERRRMGEGLDEIRQQFLSTTGAEDGFLSDPSPEATARATDRLVSLSASLGGLIQELSLIQARARLESISIEPVDLTPEEAFAIARRSRLDWMNNRAALVNTWRLITFNANALRSNLDIVFSGDMRTSRDNPVSFRADNGTLRAGLQFDGPFTRLLERNNYRQVLIDYQRDRRQLIGYQDSVNLTLRQNLRQLEQLRVNLEIQRRAVAIAVRRVDQTREVLNEPPPTAQPGEPAAQLGPTAALNLLTALSDLRSSQDNFMSVWLNYYAARMVLYRELGIMEIDNEGMWVDQPIDKSILLADIDCELPPAVPAEWLKDAGIGPADLEEGMHGPPPEMVPTPEPAPAGPDVFPASPVLPAPTEPVEGIRFRHSDAYRAPAEAPVVRPVSHPNHGPPAAANDQPPSNAPAP